MSNCFVPDIILRRETRSSNWFYSVYSVVFPVKYIRDIRFYSSHSRNFCATGGHIEELIKKQNILRRAKPIGKPKIVLLKGIDQQKRCDP